MLAAGFPCFPAGTQILTEQGFQNIEDVEEGQKVITHGRDYRKVVETMEREYEGEMVEAELPFGRPSIEATEEHPFYVVEKEEVWDGDERTHKYEFSEPKWVEASDLNEDMYIGIPTSSEVEIPQLSYEYGKNQHETETRYLPSDSEDFWWCVGHYIAEGWYEKKRMRNGEEKQSQRVVVSVDKDETEEVASRYRQVFDSVTVAEEDTANKIHIISKGFHSYVEGLGDEASEKKLPSDVFKLPDNLQSSLISGLIYGDGHNDEGTVCYTTTSDKLAEQVQHLMTAYYQKPAHITENKTADKTKIEGREVNQKDFYQIKINPEGKRIKHTLQDDIIWIKPEEINTYDTKQPTTVYNFEVRGRNSYTANGCIVHNCQAFSIAGNRQGTKDSRGKLFREIIRIAEAKRPQILLLENVKGLLSQKAIGEDGEPIEGTKGDAFTKILSSIHELGYDFIEWRVLNSKNWGVPQNRERVFIVGHLGGEPERKVFPLPREREGHQEENEGGQGQHQGDGEERGGHDQLDTVHPNRPEIGQADRVYKNDGLLPALNGGWTPQIQVEEGQEIQEIGSIYGEKGKQDGGIFSKDGVTPTLSVASGGANKFFVMDDEEKFKGEMKVVGNTVPSGHEAGNVYHPAGIAPTMRENHGKIIKILKNHRNREIRDHGDYSPTINKKQGGGQLPMVFQKELDEDHFVWDDFNSNLRDDGNTGTVTPNFGSEALRTGTKLVDLDSDKSQIRKLTPLETWRLQGFPDWAFERAEEVNSDNQLYKQAGNSVTVNVIQAIGEEIEKFY